jgi:hypothetical protein
MSHPFRLMPDRLRLENCLLRLVRHTWKLRPEGRAFEDEPRTGADQLRTGARHSRGSGDDPRTGGGQPLRLMTKN